MKTNPFKWFAQQLGWTSVTTENGKATVTESELETVSNAGVSLETQVKTLTQQLSDATARNAELEKEHTALATKAAALETQVKDLTTQVNNLLQQPAAPSAGERKGVQTGNTKPDYYAQAGEILNDLGITL